MTALCIYQFFKYILSCALIKYSRVPNPIFNFVGHLESGVMMMGALRHQDDCSLRLACRLGKLAQNSDMLRGQTAEALFQGVHAILPHKYSSFARSFQAVAKEEDLSSCEKECYRCIAI